MVTSKTIELDLLIVGGGIQGLTLLHHYTEEQKGSALLVTRDPLGKGETLHSHGYLHKGYFLPLEEALLIPDFVKSFNWWNTWMHRHQLHYEETSPVYFDLPEDQYETITQIWENADLPFEALTQLPAPLQNGWYSQPNPRRLVKIHDRLIPPWRIVETLSDPLQNLMMQGELTNISWDPQTNQIVDCTVSTPEENVCFRPTFVVLATGRETQSLLRKITGREGSHPFWEKLQSLNLIRDVPMILIKGASLPSLSGWFSPDVPITMMTHPLENGERMWVVTLMEGHQSSQEDFEDKAVAVDASMIQRTVRVLWDMIPELESLSRQLLFSSYSGAKIDHPEGLHKWFIGDGSIENLRFVWSVLWGLAYSASRELIQELSEFPLLSQSSSQRGRGFDTEKFQLPMRVEVGEEKRLSPSQRWHSIEEWNAIYQFNL